MQLLEMSPAHVLLNCTARDNMRSPVFLQLLLDGSRECLLLIIAKSIVPGLVNYTMQTCLACAICTKYIVKRRLNDQLQYG
jgi:hypothetical protein